VTGHEAYRTEKASRKQGILYDISEFLNLFRPIVILRLLAIAIVFFTINFSIVTGSFTEGMAASFLSCLIITTMFSGSIMLSEMLAKGGVIMLIFALLPVLGPAIWVLFTFKKNDFSKFGIIYLVTFGVSGLLLHFLHPDITQPVMDAFGLDILFEFYS